MDRGYLDFSQLYAVHQVGAFFVTCAKSNFNARRVYLANVNKATSVMCDQSVALNRFKAAKDYPEQLRWVRFTDPTGKTLVFLTDNTTLPAPLIASFSRTAGRSNCSSSGSSSICVSRNFWAPARTR